MVFGDQNAAHIAAISQFAMVEQVIANSDRIFICINRVIYGIDADYSEAKRPSWVPSPTV